MTLEKPRTSRMLKAFSRIIFEQNLCPENQHFEVHWVYHLFFTINVTYSCTYIFLKRLKVCFQQGVSYDDLIIIPRLANNWKGFAKDLSDTSFSKIPFYCFTDLTACCDTKPTTTCIVVCVLRCWRFF